jgi:hypothetical protein
MRLRSVWRGFPPIHAGDRLNWGEDAGVVTFLSWDGMEGNLDFAHIHCCRQQPTKITPSRANKHYSTLMRSRLYFCVCSTTTDDPHRVLLVAAGKF